MDFSTYPLQIIQTRYKGAYSGGLFCLVTGVHAPMGRLGAFGSDPEAMDFWEEVEKYGPVISISCTDDEIRQQKMRVALKIHDGVPVEDQINNIDIEDSDLISEYKDIYVAAGNNPNDLYEEFLDFCCENDVNLAGIKTIAELEEELE